jgi:lantibiotic transport system permease protein
MSFTISLQSEVLKTKRSASFWLSILAAAIMPVIFFLAFYFNPVDSSKGLHKDPWGTYFMWGWGVLNVFIFPMFVILICTLIPQIEFKNNTWKQVLASPQSLGNIYFSKFLTIHLMIFFFFLCFISLMFLSAILTNILNSNFPFFDNAVNWQMLGKLVLKTYIAILGISAIQYCISLRFKNFIAPVGIGLALLVGALVAREAGWAHIYKVPFAHPLLTLQTLGKPARPFIENHEWNSILYFLAFMLIGFLDLRFKREKG